MHGFRTKMETITMIVKHIQTFPLRVAIYMYMYIPVFYHFIDLSNNFIIIPYILFRLFYRWYCSKRMIIHGFCG